MVSAEKAVIACWSLDYLCNLWWNAVSQNLFIEALLGHVGGQATGPLKRIFKPLELHIGNCEQTDMYVLKCFVFLACTKKKNQELKTLGFPHPLFMM